MLEYWLLGFAMMLVVEGIMPFLFPGSWRETFRKLLSLTDGQLRFIGMASMLSGLLMLYLIR
ncbi:MAG TPA: DUF2065 domain-containing protein [Gallionella sp.]|nr:DUF2065 domain-containing protein [Gallionella sp.]